MFCQECYKYQAAPDCDLCNQCQLEKHKMSGIFVAPLLVICAALMVCAIVWKLAHG